jgi:drug/metabolite transporter (DMT)-like permease
MGIGESAALTAAFMWTCSSMIWGKIQLPALVLNFFKNWIGVTLVLIHLAVLALVSSDRLVPAPAESWLWLGLSGIVGIVVGDTLYFRSLQILGPRRALMVATTAPLFSAVFASLLLNESLMFTAVIGILMTVAGVVVVVADRKATSEAPGLMPGKSSLGATAGVIGAVCQSVGGVFSKKGMVDSQGVECCDAVEATLIRLLVAAIVTTLVLVCGRNFKKHFASGANWKMFRFLIPATALGTWIGIWLSQIAYQKADVAIAQTLMATCPLFAIPIVWFVHKQKVTALAFVGTLIALVGIYLTVGDVDLSNWLVQIQSWFGM